MDYNSDQYLGAKDLITKYFYDLTNNIMSIIQENEMMSLSGGLPLMILAFCCVAEVIYILLDQIEGKSDVIPRILKMIMFLSLCFIVYGKIGYSALQLEGNGRDFLRDIHTTSRNFFNSIGGAITNNGPEAQDKSITNLVRRQGLIRHICDDEPGGDPGKMACVKKLEEKPLKEVQDKWDEKYYCKQEMGNFVTNSLPVLCALDDFITIENIFVVGIQMLSILRYVCFAAITLLYILTVVLTYVMLKMLFPFIIFHKTRGQILSGFKFYLSTTTIVALLGLLEYIFNLSMAGLFKTTFSAGAASMSGVSEFATFGLYFFLSAVICTILIGIEIVMYFKIPELSKNVWDLNISMLVTLSEVAKDGLQLGMQILGVSGTVASTAGTFAIAKSLGLDRLFPKPRQGATQPGSGGGDGTSGGGSTGSNFSSGAETSSYGSESYPGRDNTTQGYYAGNSGLGVSNNSSGTSYARQAPESQVDPSDLGAFKRGSAEVETMDDNTDGHNDYYANKSADQDSAGASGPGPESAVNPGLLNKMSGATRKTFTGIKKKAGKVVQPMMKKASDIKNMSAKDWMKAGGMAAVGAAKLGGKGVIGAAKLGSKASVTGFKFAAHAAAGDLRGAFVEGVIRPLEGASASGRKMTESTLEANYQKKWNSGGLSSADLESGEGDREMYEVLTKGGPDAHLEKEVTQYESLLQAAEDERRAAVENSLAGGSYEDVEIAKGKIAQYEELIAARQAEIRAQEEEYHRAKQAFIEQLKDDDFVEKEKSMVLKMMERPGAFTSDELKDIFTNPEVKGFIHAAELKKQADRDFNRLRNMIKKDTEKEGTISVKTKKEIEGLKDSLTPSQKEQLVKLANPPKRKK